MKIVKLYFVLFALGVGLMCDAYTPVVTPNGTTLPYKMDGNVKEFHLVAEPVKREFAPGMTVNCWGYNGQTPGPTIEAVEGDTVRIFVTNRLPEATTVHWHGILLPSGMDGVAGVNQRPIPPGETFKYEFTLKQSGTHMYHPHYDEMTQIALGMMGFFIIHPKNPGNEEKVDRDYAIMLHEWFIPIGGATPDPMVMLDFNYFTFNSSVWPGTKPLVAKQGEKVRIRFGNLSMNNHPIHIHGFAPTVTAMGAQRMPKSAQYQVVTIDVPPGNTRDWEFVADALGDWSLHCHKTHHVMNGMEHNIPNLIGVSQEGLEDKIRVFLPGYMSMGTTGMGEMYDMHAMGEHMGGNGQMGGHHMQGQGLKNYLPMGSPGPHGTIEMSGMFTVLKVREKIDGNEDPGWYINPPGTQAERVDYP